MSEFKVRIDSLNGTMDAIAQMESVLRQTAGSVSQIKRDLNVQIRQRERIDSRLIQISRQLEAQGQGLGRTARAGRQAASLYQKNEQQLLQTSKSGHSNGGQSAKILNQQLELWLKSFLLKVKEWLFPEPKEPEDYEINSVVFDDDGSYGGDQGSPRSRQGEEQRALYDIVRSYYPNYSDYEISQLMKKLNSEGCGYVAVINTIFAAYEGREAEFEKTFGFPMYGKDGDLNYDRLLVDYYAATDNHNKFLWFDRVDKHEDYGKDDKGNWFTYNNRTDTTGAGTSQYDREYRTHLYLDQKGVPVNVKTDYKVTPASFPQASKDGYVIIAYRYGNLQNEDGSVAQYIDGGHAMVVTGVTEDGRYVVSSWGEKYYIDPEECVQKNGNSTSFTFSYYQYG